MPQNEDEIKILSGLIVLHFELLDWLTTSPHENPISSVGAIQRREANIQCSYVLQLK